MSQPVTSYGSIIVTLHVCYGVSTVTYSVTLLSGGFLTVDDFSGPDSKVHGDNMGPIWGRYDPGGPHVGPMNFAIWGTKGR